MKKLFFISLALSFILFGQQAKSSELKSEGDMTQLEIMNMAECNYTCSIQEQPITVHVQAEVRIRNGIEILIIRIIGSGYKEFYPTNGLVEPTVPVAVDKRYYDALAVYQIVGEGSVAIEIKEISTDNIPQEVIFVNVRRK